MVNPKDIAAMLDEATAAMRVRGVKRLRWGELEIDLEELPVADPPPEDRGAPPQPEIELFADPYEDPDLYGGRVPTLRRKE